MNLYQDYLWQLSHFIESTFGIRIFSSPVSCHLLKTNLEVITASQSAFNCAVLLFVEMRSCGYRYFGVTALALEIPC